MTLNDSSSFLDTEGRSRGMLSRQGTIQATNENYQKDKILEELNLISSRDFELTKIIRSPKEKSSETFFSIWEAAENIKALPRDRSGKRAQIS
jgi:hypothetical protein